jgi:hypothetical protein
MDVHPSVKDETTRSQPRWRRLNTFLLKCVPALINRTLECIDPDGDGSRLIGGPAELYGFVETKPFNPFSDHAVGVRMLDGKEMGRIVTE